MGMTEFPGKSLGLHPKKYLILFSFGVVKQVEVKGRDGVVRKSTKVVTVWEEREVVHVKVASDFVLHIIWARGMDPAKTLVRIGLDGGGGSFKIMISIADAEGNEAEEEEEEENGGGEKPGSSRKKSCSGKKLTGRNLHQHLTLGI